MNLKIKKLKEHFEKQDAFSEQDVLQFYQSFYPKIEVEVLFWNIFDLKERGVIEKVGKDRYQLVRAKNQFTPNLKNSKNPSFEDLAKVIQEGFDLEKCVIWTTEWLNQFTLHQVQQHFMLIEVEKELCESVFFHLKDAGYSNVFLQPNSELMDRYVNEAKSPIVVTNLISRAPIKKAVSKIDFSIPTLEKILVDVFSEEAIFMAFKGAEQTVIFENVIRYYELNFKKLFAYAKRRNREVMLKKYLYESFYSLVETVM